VNSKLGSDTFPRGIFSDKDLNIPHQADIKLINFRDLFVTVLLKKTTTMNSNSSITAIKNLQVRITFFYFTSPVEVG
jgi:hypothetical protein